MDTSPHTQQEETAGPSLAEYFATFKRRRWQFILPAGVLLTLAILAAVGIPAVYRSQATILIEQQEIPADLVRSTVTGYADQRVQIISQRVLNSANLSRVIEKYNLYPDRRKVDSMATIIEKMRQDIALHMVSADVVDPRSGRPTTATIAFTLAYENRSPQLAQQVSNEIVSLFLNENVKKRRETAREASNFLTEEADKLSKQITMLEAKLATFKEKNSESLPELQSLNMTLMQRTEDQLQRNEQDLRTLDERIIYLESQLVLTNPYSNLYSSTGERVLSAVDRLKSLEAEYISVASRYSANHPDRIKIERELEALRQQVGGADVAELQRHLTELNGQLVVLQERYSSDHPDVKRVQSEIQATDERLAQALEAGLKLKPQDTADNPAYVQLQAQLQAARAQHSSLGIANTELQKKLTSFESSLGKTPKIEREYRELSRDYENATLKFREVRAKQLEAELAESLEVESKAERFVLIEPPVLPEAPAKPNRWAIILLGFVFSVGGGVGTVVLRESMDDALHGAKDIIKIIGEPPLAVIPYFVTDAELALGQQRRMHFLLGAAVVSVATLILVHFQIRPLDVLLFQLLHRLM